MVDKSKTSVVAMVLGIISILVSCIDAINFIAFISLAISIYCVCGKINRHIATAVIGLISSLIACAIAVIVTLASIPIDKDSGLNKNITSETLGSTNEDDNTFIIKPKEIYKKDNVTINFIGNTSDSDVMLGFKAINKSKKDINISITGIAINNITFAENELNDGLYEGIMSGDKSNFNIEVKEEILSEYNIKIIKKIEIMFLISNEDNEFNSNQFCATLYSNRNDKKYDAIKGSKVYSDKNFDIQYISNKGNTYKFSIYNKRKQYVEYYLDKCSVNDYSFDVSESETSVFDKPVFSKSYSIFEIKVDDDFCKKNEIDDVKKIKFTMYADSDASTFCTAGDIKTKKIEVEFK